MKEHVRASLIKAAKQMDKLISTIGDLSMRDLHKSGVDLAKIIEALDCLEGINLFLNETLLLEEAIAIDSDEDKNELGHKQKRF